MVKNHLGAFCGRQSIGFNFFSKKDFGSFLLSSSKIFRLYFLGYSFFFFILDFCTSITKVFHVSYFFLFRFIFGFFVFLYINAYFFLSKWYKALFSLFFFAFRIFSKNKLRYFFFLFHSLIGVYDRRTIYTSIKKSDKRGIENRARIRAFKAWFHGAKSYVYNIRFNFSFFFFSFWSKIVFSKAVTNA